MNFVSRFVFVQFNDSSITTTISCCQKSVPEVVLCAFHLHSWMASWALAEGPALDDDDRVGEEISSQPRFEFSPCVHD